MWCIAICHDGENASAARKRQFQAHVAHNIANIGRFLLTGVLASADGVTEIESDPRLMGSLYCLDIESLAAARDLMESDPFADGAWAQIDYFRWDSPSGLWLDETARPKGLRPDYGCYLAASRAPLAVEDALMSGAVVPLASTGASAEPLAAVAVLRAASMAEARVRAKGAAWVAAVPVAIGRWVNIVAAADLAAARN
jgi:uncharacterized protein YciI